MTLDPKVTRLDPPPASEPRSLRRTKAKRPASPLARARAEYLLGRVRACSACRLEPDDLDPCDFSMTRAELHRAIDDLVRRKRLRLVQTRTGVGVELAPRERERVLARRALRATTR